MSTCTACGHRLEVGRYCLNCGRPVSGPSTAAEAGTAPATGGVEPPPAGAHPPPARYPLYADPPTSPAPPPPPVPTGSPRAPQSHAAPRRRGGWIPVAAVAALVLIATLGAVLLWGGLWGGDDPAEPVADPAGAGSQQTASGSTDDTPSSDAGTSGAPESTEGSRDPSAPTENITDRVEEVEVPGSAPASVDGRDGSRVTFGAGNLTDGDPVTAWRVAGDSSGSTLTLTFAGPVEIREVGLLNGYAKTYPGYDGYRSNRRVLAVEWVFADGSSVRQDLGDSRDLQMIPIDTVVTDRVELRIVEVSSPGGGSSGRDYTAISEIAFGGVPA